MMNLSLPTSHQLVSRTGRGFVCFRCPFQLDTNCFPYNLHASSARHRKVGIIRARFDNKEKDPRQARRAIISGRGRCAMHQLAQQRVQMSHLLSSGNLLAFGGLLQAAMLACQNIGNDGHRHFGPTENQKTTRGVPSPVLSHT